MKNIFYKIGRFFSDNWRLAVLDLKKGRWLIRAEPSMVPYLKAENACGRHILLQPFNEACYMLADDLDLSLLKCHHQTPGGAWKSGRMVIETSPDNYQVWIRTSRPLSNDAKRYWLGKMHSDKGATPENRWGRMPGFRNRKEKYKKPSNHYPLSRLIWVDWANSAVVPHVNLKSRQNKVGPESVFTKMYENTSICRSDYEKGNESVTDFSYALALGRKGFDAESIKKRLLQERQNWKNHYGDKRLNDYLNRTVLNAMKIIASS